MSMLRYMKQFASTKELIGTQLDRLDNVDVLALATEPVDGDASAQSLLNAVVCTDMRQMMVDLNAMTTPSPPSSGFPVAATRLAGPALPDNTP